MLYTNTLFGLAFTLVSNFTNTVNVPPIAVPQSTNDLERYAVIVRRNDVEVLMMHKRGVMAAISHGTVMKYDTPGSFFQLQDPDLINKFKGPARLTRKQAIELAATTVKRLQKRGKPFDSSKTIVQAGGRDIPFYNIIFSSPTNSHFQTAGVEVDARNGSIPAIWLRGDEFWDQKESDDFRHQVYLPDPKTVAETKIEPKRRVRSPSQKPLTDTNSVIKMLEPASLIAGALNMDSKFTLCVSNVDWEASGHRACESLGNQELYCVQFKDGSLVQVYDDAVVLFDGPGSFFAADLWVHQRSEPEQNPKYPIKDLVQGFEERLRKNYGFPKSFFREYKAQTIGRSGVRHLIGWKRHRSDNVEQGFLVEFDMNTGLVMAFRVQMAEVAELFVKGQKKLERIQPRAAVSDSDSAAKTL